MPGKEKDPRCTKAKTEKLGINGLKESPTAGRNLRVKKKESAGSPENKTTGSGDAGGGEACRPGRKGGGKQSASKLNKKGRRTKEGLSKSLQSGKIGPFRRGVKEAGVG